MGDSENEYMFSKFKVKTFKKDANMKKVPNLNLDFLGNSRSSESRMSFIKEIFDRSGSDGHTSAIRDNKLKIGYWTERKLPTSIIN
jgi:hypothetical protein